MINTSVLFHQETQCFIIRDNPVQYEKLSKAQEPKVVIGE